MDSPDNTPKELRILGANRFETYTRTRHASRSVIVRDDEILLSYAARRDLWMIPGGGRDKGETAEECCTREAMEETGFQVKPVCHFLLIHEYYEECLYLTDYYVCEILGEAPRHLTEAEVRVGLRTEWVPLKEALRIFSRHADYADQDEQKRGLYLREYRALQVYQEFFGPDAPVSLS